MKKHKIKDLMKKKSGEKREGRNASINHVRKFIEKIIELKERYKVHERYTDLVLDTNVEKSVEYKLADLIRLFLLGKIDRDVFAGRIGDLLLSRNVFRCGLLHFLEPIDGGCKYMVDGLSNSLITVFFDDENGGLDVDVIDPDAEIGGVVWDGDVAGVSFSYLGVDYSDIVFLPIKLFVDKDLFKKGVMFFSDVVFSEEKISGGMIVSFPLRKDWLERVFDLRKLAESLFFYEFSGYVDRDVLKEVWKRLDSQTLPLFNVDVSLPFEGKTIEGVLEVNVDRDGFYFVVRTNDDVFYIDEMIPDKFIEKSVEDLITENRENIDFVKKALDCRDTDCLIDMFFNEYWREILKRVASFYLDNTVHVIRGDDEEEMDIFVLRREK